MVVPVSCRAALIAAALVVLCALPALAEDVEQKDEVLDIGTVHVMERGARPVTLEPRRETIDIEEYELPGTPASVVDVLRTMPLVDFRQESDMVPEDDSVYLRGFDSTRFSTAMNGLTIRQSGGRKSSNIVDYGALIPLWMIGDIEILPGPHSALYPAKSFGGVLNIRPRVPSREELQDAQVNFSASYGSFNTASTHLDGHGGVDSVFYDLGVQRYTTDGYLRHTDAEIDTFYGRGGYLFEDDGFLTLSYLYVDADRNLAVANDPTQADFDDDYPHVDKDTPEFSDWQHPASDKVAQSVDLYFVKPTGMGEVSVAASHRTENRDRKYDEIPRGGGPVQDGSWNTKWEQRAVKLMDVVEINGENTLTVGVEGSQLLDGYGRTNWDSAYASHERVRTLAGFAEHNWDITPRLHLSLGARYESVETWTANVKSSGDKWISYKDDWINRTFDGFTPKSFLTWELDDVDASLRDTSVSVGVSRIWRAPDYHGNMNPQGRPTGAWLDPEHGMGYDLVLQRRLTGDITMKVDFSYYKIYDYMTYNRSFSVLPDYKDYQINLDEVEQKGVEIVLGGHLTDELAFTLGYAYIDMDSLGGELAGEQAVDQRAKHRVNAGLSYALTPQTTLIANYQFKDKQTTEIINYDRNTDVVDSHTEDLDAFHLFDFAVEHTLFDEWKGLSDGTVKVYVNNAFDERYQNVDGYPGTERNFGVSFSVSM
ncbi:TonB-dependent receptor [Desulfobaculum sp. SPO524]|uniref:TonB-dependent receptor n=1 Tax=Desulfobaculum sp. SPO524 TaxID=3378071 RepID=UPI003854B795